MTTPSGATPKLHLSELLEGSRVGPFQIRVFVLCMACLIMDGFDVQAMGYVGPALLRDWNVPGPQLGPVFAAANFGVLLGALLFGMLADKIGRRPVLVGATLFFSVLTIATAYARDMDELLWLRFVSGLGLGCIIPNATALVGEYSPRKSRIALTMCITVGFTLGAAIGGFVALQLIPAFGWRSVFIFGGGVPLVIAIAMLWGLPESLQFLAVRKQRFDELARWLRQLDPTLRVDASTEFIANETSRGGVPMIHLFRDGRALFTILLWIVNFTNILVLYTLSNWLPTIFNAMGYTEQTSLFVGTLLQVGGTIGTFGLAWLIARRGFTSMLAVTFAIATASIAFIGHPALTLVPLSVIVFIAGWCIVGAQPGVNTLSASYYPTYLRATGVGAGLGVGRIGAIVGPLIGGILLARDWAPQQLFWAAALPALVSTLVMLALRVLLKNDRGSAQLQTVAPPLAH
jgi:AAHS family 4-hydroxybenzoate transporter-like MFS transporter